MAGWKMHTSLSIQPPSSRSGLRVLTSGGVTSGIDGALYMVGALVSDDSADEVARIMCHKWQKGIVVDGVDV